MEKPNDVLLRGLLGDGVHAQLAPLRLPEVPLPVGPDPAHQLGLQVPYVSHCQGEYFFLEYWKVRTMSKSRKS